MFTLMTLLFLNGQPVPLVVDEGMKEQDCRAALAVGVASVLLTDGTVLDVSNYKFICARET